MYGSFGHFKKIKYNKETQGHYIHYDIDTYNGQSGGPILVMENKFTGMTIESLQKNIKENELEVIF